jgi:hypothetical protein
LNKYGLEEAVVMVFMKMMADDRETAVGRSTYQRNYTGPSQCV